MSATVLPFIARKPARTEAERACQIARESMTLRLLREQVEQREFDEATRFYEAAEERV